MAVTDNFGRISDGGEVYKPMRILYLCQRIPYPPDRGDRIPVYHQIRRLRENHEVVVGSLAHPGTWENAKALEKAFGISVIAPEHSRLRQIWEITASFLRGEPLTLGYFRNPELRQRINAELALNRFDVVIIFSSSMAQYVEHHRHIPKIMNFCDVDSQKWTSMALNSCGLKRWIYRRESRTLLTYERKLAASSTVCCVVSRNEAELFQKYIPETPVHVLENGVDVDYFSAIPPETDGLNIVFVGVMDYAPNVEAVTFFANNVWSGIREAHAQARFIIIGANPSQSVRELVRIPGIEVTGYVPDIRPYLSTATVSIAPLEIARGVQNKILEAMSAGIPVLTTPEVARGLPDGATDLVFTAKREAFAAALLYLINNRNIREKHALEAREFIIRNNSWEVKLLALDDILARVVK